MKLCSKCGKLSHYNSYFGVYICEKCGYREPERTSGLNSRAHVVSRPSGSAASPIAGRYARQKPSDPEMVLRSRD